MGFLKTRAATSKTDSWTPLILFISSESVISITDNVIVFIVLFVCILTFGSLIEESCQTEIFSASVRSMPSFNCCSSFNFEVYYL